MTGWYVDPLVRDRWVELFQEFSFPSSCDSHDDLLALWSSVRHAISHVLNSLFATRGGHPHRPNALPWWSPACRDALSLLKHAPSSERQRAHVAL